MNLSANDQIKLDQLKRVKRFATAILVACFALYLATRWAQTEFPAYAATLGLLVAFTEAATIGGLADWYAVVVLFRHPMGIKIPHTAIIPANQNRIADNLGLFLERNFLSETVVNDKLKDTDFAHHIVTWLSDKEHSTGVSNFVVKLVPDVLAAIEDSGFKRFGAKRIARQIQKTEITPIATKLIDSFVSDGRYQALLDEIIDALANVMQDEATLKTIQKRVAEELPTVLYILQADTVILNRIVRSTTTLLAEVKDNPEHPLRQEFSELFEGYVTNMKNSRRFARRVERLKQDLVTRPEFTSLADGLWNELGAYVTRDSRKKNPVLARELTGMLVGFAQQLDGDGELKKEINSGLRTVLSSLAHEQKSKVSEFVSEEVRSWNFRQLVLLIEANVGRDLQYIRFNGMIIGGVAGVILHLLEINLF